MAMTKLSTRELRDTLYTLRKYYSLVFLPPYTENHFKQRIAQNPSHPLSSFLCIQSDRSAQHENYPVHFRGVEKEQDWWSLSWAQM